MQQAVMIGIARYQDWRREFMAQWKEGIDKQDAAIMFAALPPDLKEAMKRADPKAYEQLVSQLNSR
jgi:hypothetical protein